MRSKHKCKQFQRDAVGFPSRVGGVKYTYEQETTSQGRPNRRISIRFEKIVHWGNFQPHLCPLYIAYLSFYYLLERFYSFSIASNTPLTFLYSPFTSLLYTICFIVYFLTIFCCLPNNYLSLNSFDYVSFAIEQFEINF